MSLYHSVQVNPDSDPVIVEVNNLDWKSAYYRRERRKKTVVFLFSLIVISGCIASFWTYKASLGAMIRRDRKNIVRTGAYFQDEQLPQTSVGPNTTSTPAPTCITRMVAYYPGNSRRTITARQLSHLTHVIFASMIISEDGYLLFKSGHEERRFLKLKRNIESGNDKVKLMVSIEEEGVEFSFSKVSADARKRQTFFNSISDQLANLQLDGVDLNWRFPYREDLENQVKLIKELREHLDRLSEKNGRQNRYIISIVAPALGQTSNNQIGENLENLLEFVDFVNVMSFDYSIFYRNHTGPTAPLFSFEGFPSVNTTLSYYSRSQESSKKLNLGVAFHGTYWNNVNEPVKRENWRSLGTPKGYVERGQVAYRNIEKEEWTKSTGSWDEESKTPYILDQENKRFLSFENKRSLKKKMNFARKKNLGAVSIWSLEMDDSEDTLLRAVTTEGICT
ncbi:hypothetical protein CAEBREN_31234 [Caenorhabditis brenneri]|uniref:GH18 domain-containing protein n=1 Tax=Caenorhabditis brenneri TaxID=135651 RepID=G0NF25_CAEBE|nr:hypothetical protein CAEBREN_31234 [Caenorhabditis brenneri]